MLKTTRRTLIQSGAAGIAITALGGLSRLGSAAEVKRRKKLVLVFAKGGWDVTYALDPKPEIGTIDAPDGRRALEGGVDFWANDSRPSVTEFFRRYGSVSAVVNGIQMMSFVHPDCWKRVLTGTASDASPDLGAITAYEHGRALPAPYLVLGQTAYTGPLASIAARTGSTNQIAGILDPMKAPPSDAEVEGLRRSDLSERVRERIRRYVLARAERERAVRGQSGYNRRRFEDFFSSVDRAAILKGYSSDFGGRTPTNGLTKQAELAVKALETGLSQAVHLEYGVFDSHANNSAQDRYHEALFSTLLRLVDGLATRPGVAGGGTLLDETVVAVLSEMGRTPKLNADQGKDHWPVTSALIVGAGVRGGRVLGGTNDRLQAENVNFETGAVESGGLQLLFSNLAAGVLTLAGVDSKAYLPNVEVFRAFIA